MAKEKKNRILDAAKKFAGERPFPGRPDSFFFICLNNQGQNILGGQKRVVSGRLKYFARLQGLKGVGVEL